MLLAVKVIVDAGKTIQAGFEPTRPKAQAGLFSRLAC